MLKTEIFVPLEISRGPPLEISSTWKYPGGLAVATPWKFPGPEYFQVLKISRLYKSLCPVKIKKRFKKKWEKVWSFAKPPPGPPPPLGLTIFPEKNFPPFFFRNKILIGWNKFYTWSHLKIYSFFAFKIASIIAIFPQDLGRSGYVQSCPNSCRYEIGTPDQV